MAAYDAELDDARKAVTAEKDARDGWDDALAARDDAVRALFTAAPDIGPTAIGAMIGLTASTVRGITRDLAAERRRAQGR